MVGLIVVAIAAVVAGIGYWLVTQAIDRGRQIHRTVSDTNGLVHAIDKARSADGGTITLTSGMYRIDHGLDVPPNVTIDGKGATLELTQNASAAVSLSSGTKLLNINVRARGQTPALISVLGSAEDVAIKDCQLQGVVGAQVGIRTAGAVTGLTVNDTSIRDVKQGVVLTSPKKATLSKVHVTDWTTRGVWILGEGNDSAKNVTLSGLTIGPNVGAGHSRYPIFVTATGEPNEAVTIKNTKVTGRSTAWNDPNRPGTADQISVTKTKGVTIEQNTSIDGGGRGINVSSSMDVTVKGNTVQNADTAGIGVGSLDPRRGVQNVSVTDNTITNSGLSRTGAATPTERAGIRLAHVSHGTATGNTVIVDQGGSRNTFGVTVAGGSAVTVKANSFRGPMVQQVLRNSG